MNTDAWWVQFVRQRSDWDCWVACIAMVSGYTYEEVLAAVPQTRVGKRLSTHELPYMLGACGVAVRMVYEDAAEQPAGLRIICTHGHYVVVLPSGAVHDPARGEAQDGELSHYAQPFAVWEVHRP